MHFSNKQWIQTLKLQDWVTQNFVGFELEEEMMGGGEEDGGREKNFIRKKYPSILKKMALHVHLMVDLDGNGWKMLCN